MARDLGKSRGSLISEMKPKNATWATVKVSKCILDLSPGSRTVGKDNVGHGQEGLVESDIGSDIVLDVIWSLNTDGNHGDNSRDENRETSCRRISFCRVQSSYRGIIQITDMMYTLPIVRGRAPRKLTIKPTTPKTMLQVP